MVIVHLAEETWETEEAPVDRPAVIMAAVTAIQVVAPAAVVHRAEAMVVVIMAVDGVVSTAADVAPVVSTVVAVAVGLTVAADSGAWAAAEVVAVLVAAEVVAEAEVAIQVVAEDAGNNNR